LGGTLHNGKVTIELRKSHGRMLRELIARVRFEPGDDVTCYGGFVMPAPPPSDEHTHMRHIPSTDYVLEGLPFSNCFPETMGAVCHLGYRIPLKPSCVDPDWTKMIATSGIGYMANTVTKCPLGGRARPNVRVCEARLGRVIEGVPYDSVMLLRASNNGIDIGDRIISPYEPWNLKKMWSWECVDPMHYAASGREKPINSDSGDGDE
jgi:hypothetical protein